MAKLLTGAQVVSAMGEEVRARVRALCDAGIAPVLALVRVGARPDDVAYERSLLKRAEKLGIAVRVIELAEDAGEDALLREIERINEDPSVHGCLLFRPLPASFDETRICDSLASAKDIDGISRASLAGLYVGDETAFAPSTAEACVKMLDHYGVEIAGSRIAVVGRSLVIGKPVSTMLLARDATVTLCHSKTRDLADITRSADIVVCATGRPRAFDASFFAPGQVVLDVGINFDAAGDMCGDVDFASVEPVAFAITPVPGGLGGLTALVTMEHVVRAAELACARA